MHDWQSEVRARLAPLNLKPEREADIVDEISQHLAERYREALSVGASSDEAIRLALGEFRAGNVLAQHIAELKQAHAPATSQRTREIGIRIALGAQLADVRNLFLRHGLWLTAAGLVLGIGLALVLTRVMSAYLFGVGPMDPVTYAAVSALLAAIALLATYLPARRAARIDPNVALRADN